MIGQPAEYARISPISGTTSASGVGVKPKHSHLRVPRLIAVKKSGQRVARSLLIPNNNSFTVLPVYIV